MMSIHPLVVQAVERQIALSTDEADRLRYLVGTYVDQDIADWAKQKDLARADKLDELVISLRRELKDHAQQSK